MKASSKEGSIDLIFTTNMLQSVFFVEMASSVVINHFFMRSGKNYCKNRAIVLIHQKTPISWQMFFMQFDDIGLGKS